MARTCPERRRCSRRRIAIRTWWSTTGGGAHTMARTCRASKCRSPRSLPRCTCLSTSWGGSSTTSCMGRWGWLWTARRRAAGKKRRRAAWLVAAAIAGNSTPNCCRCREKHQAHNVNFQRNALRVGNNMSMCQGNSQCPGCKHRGPQHTWTSRRKIVESVR